MVYSGVIPGNKYVYEIINFTFGDIFIKVYQEMDDVYTKAKFIE